MFLYVTRRRSMSDSEEEQVLDGVAPEAVKEHIERLNENARAVVACLERTSAMHTEEDPQVT
jgi:hypothetical protein